MDIVEIEKLQSFKLYCDVLKKEIGEFAYLRMSESMKKEFYIKELEVEVMRLKQVERDLNDEILISKGSLSGYVGYKE